jgi:imidazolonepropionase-like amidohydrolase
VARVSADMGGAAYCTRRIRSLGRTRFRRDADLGTMLAPPFRIPPFGELRMLRRPPRRALVLAASLAVAWTAQQPARSSPLQATPSPQFYVVRDVRLEDKPDAPRKTLVLRGGRIQSVLEVQASNPPGARVVEGAGQLALPAFVDAYTQAGCVTPAPKVDRDLPADTRADAQVDMREANRKGIQPAFRAVDVFELTKDKAKAYREAGFGVLLSTPQGQLLSGSSVLATTREAAPRDAVIDAEVCLHGAFRANGPGYPATPMGYVAQLRQFFLDAQRQRELNLRFELGRPGLRPPFDADLQAALPLLEPGQRLVCEADSARAIERWIALGDELGFQVAISGGREAWKLAEVLAVRQIPVFLTLQWGEEVKDPHEKEKKEKEKKEKEKQKPPPEAKPTLEKPEAKPTAEKPPGEKPPEAPDAPPEEPKPQAPPTQEPAKPAETAPPSKPGEKQEGEKKPAEKAPDKKAEEKKLWEYEEPMAVREEKRRLWEEGRDCALKLHAAGVRFAFGSDSDSPGELLKKVRTLVELGLPQDVALAGLTTSSAELLGAASHLGRIAPGADATFALWTAHPLTKDAKLAWLFIDGYPSEFEIQKDEVDTGKPDEGVDATGTWLIEVQAEDNTRKYTFKLAMEENGDVTGTLATKNPRDDSDISADCKGHVSGKTLTLKATLTAGRGETQMELKGELAGDEFTGESTTKAAFGEFTRPAKGTRTPKQGERSSEQAGPSPEMSDRWQRR